MLTDLLSRERWAVWERAGRKDLLQRAEDRVRKILKTPPADHLSGSQREELERIEKRWLEKLSRGQS
jgi:trimethylamine:corrinoid methyltransferase-like protein